MIKEIVVVVCDRDKELHLLQMLSWAAFLPRDYKITVILNGTIDLVKFWVTEVKPRIRSLNYEVIGSSQTGIPLTGNGWHDQQALKLWAVARAYGRGAVVVDSKDFLICPGNEFLSTPVDGLYWAGYAQDNPMGVKFWAQAEGLFQIGPLSSYYTAFSRVMRPTTPSVLLREVVEDMVDNNPDFYRRFFAVDQWPSEFLYYWVWAEIGMGGFNQFHQYADLEHIWVRYYRQPGVAIKWGDHNSQCPWVSIHHDVWRAMTPTYSTRVQNYIRKQGIPLDYTLFKC